MPYVKASAAVGAFLGVVIGGTLSIISPILGLLAVLVATGVAIFFLVKLGEK